MDLAIQIYHRMPHQLRSIAATLRGAYLHSWRYGVETERLVAEAIEREQWSRERWKLWQAERLAFVLHRAATRVPYYRDQWTARRLRGDIRSFEQLENWPLLEKESIRKNPHAFVADDCQTRRMFHEYTSGTTGKPLDLWWSRQTVRAWYALFEARWRRWYGVTMFDRWAILGGQLVVPTSQSRPPFWVWNIALKQLYMSSYHLSRGNIPLYLDALKRHRIVYLFGYTSALYELACEALRLGRTDMKMTVAIANAEPVFPYQRETISRAFQCPVRATYGMAEIVAAAGECNVGALHVWPEVGLLEMFEDGNVTPGALQGEIVSTGLINADMPLIRYRVGDMATLRTDSIGCSCGRTMPLMDEIEGRNDDILLTVDGRRIGRLDPVFKVRLPIREAQIIQESLSKIRVLVVPDDGFSNSAANEIIEQIQARLGKIEVVTEPVEKIPRTANGKFQAVRSKLSRQALPGQLCPPSKK